MAQKTLVVFEDDLTGGPADRTVKFGIDGTSYEIDLSEKNAAKLRKAFTPYVKAGRKVTTTRRAARTASRGSGPSPQEVRAWARSEGIEVKDKGRVPAELIVRFQAAGQ
jgi:Lsr2